MSVASKIPEAEWNKYKDVLRHLYKKHPLNEVVTKAATDHGFHARYVYADARSRDLM